MKTHYIYFFSAKTKLFRVVFFLGFVLSAGSALRAQPSSFKKGIYMNITTESSFVMYNNVSYNTLDCINTACKTSYIDGVTFKILWKDVKIDSSSGILSFKIYKQELSVLLKAVTGYNKAVAIALYAGAFTPPAVFSAMPANHVLANIRLASQSGGPCLTDSIVTDNLTPGLFSIPAPWDKVYQNNFRNIMRILSNYLVQNKITLSYISFTGINEYSAETRMPNDICQTRDSSGTINFFQNDYVLWKNAGFNGNKVSASSNQARRTFDAFLDTIYDQYSAFKNTVLCVEGMGAVSEFPKVPGAKSNYSYDDPLSINYYDCETAYDTTSDVFAAMLCDGIKDRKPKNSFASMYCSMNEIYDNSRDYAGIINDDQGDNTELCKSLKAYHLRDVEFITGTVAPSKVAKPFADDFSQALYNCVQYGAHFIEVFPYDIYAAEQESKAGLKNEFQNAFNFAHQQITTVSPDYNGYPATTSISITSSGTDSVAFSIPVLPVVNSYTWQLDGIKIISGSNIPRLALPKVLLPAARTLFQLNTRAIAGPRQQA